MSIEIHFNPKNYVSLSKFYKHFKYLFHVIYISYFMLKTAKAKLLKRFCNEVDRKIILEKLLFSLAIVSGIVSNILQTNQDLEQNLKLLLISVFV